MNAPVDRSLTPEELEDLVANAPKTPEERYERASAALNDAENEYLRWCAIGRVAKSSLETGRLGEAQDFALQLLEMSPSYRDDWNYGNAIHDSNLVLGVVALREGSSDRACEYLLEAGKSPGSPQMNSFGPNMTLAKELFHDGRQEVVIQYLNLCRGFWSSHSDQLDEWVRNIVSGECPDFGPHLIC